MFQIRDDVPEKHVGSIIRLAGRLNSLVEQKHEGDRSKWTRLQAKYLRERDSDWYRGTRDEILRTGLFECDWQWRMRKHSMSYRFPSHLWDSQTAILRINQPDVVEAVKKSIRSAPLSEVAQILRGFYGEARICYQLVREKISQSDNPERDERHIASVLLGHFSFTQDFAGGRLYGRHTVLRKNYRDILRAPDDDAVLWEIDIATSQPFFAGLEAKSQGCCDNEYNRACVSGSLYDVFVEQLGISRSEAKVLTLKTLYKRPYTRPTGLEPVFEQRYPRFWDWVCSVKGDRAVKRAHAQLAISMQKRERVTMIDTVARRAIEEIPNFWCLTIHDSALLRERDIAPYTTILREEFDRLGMQPSIHIRPAGS
jgi:hypothetical protein